MRFRLALNLWKMFLLSAPTGREPRYLASTYKFPTRKHYVALLSLPFSSDTVSSSVRIFGGIPPVSLGGTVLAGGSSEAVSAWPSSLR